MYYDFFCFENNYLHIFTAVSSFTTIYWQYFQLPFIQFKVFEYLKQNTGILYKYQSINFGIC